MEDAQHQIGRFPVEWNVKNEKDTRLWAQAVSARGKGPRMVRRDEE